MLILGTPEETIVTCTLRDQKNLLLRRLSNVNIKGITFVGCSFEIRESNNTKISQSVFVNGTDRILEVHDCFNVSIDQSSVQNNTGGPLLDVERSVNVSIDQSFFQNNNGGRLLRVLSCSNVSIDRSFIQNNNGGQLLQVYNCFNVSIDQSSVQNNIGSSIILEMTRNRNATITRSNFTNNAILSVHRIAIVNFYISSGFVSCSLFQNNSSPSDGFNHIVKLELNSVIFVTSSSFINNRMTSSIIYVDSATAALVVMSCVFNSNIARRHEGALRINKAIGTILASDFSNNRHGHSILGDHLSTVSVDCNRYFNNSVNYRKAVRMYSNNFLSVHNSATCDERFAVGEQGVCLNTDCKGRLVY